MNNRPVNNGAVRAKVNRELLGEVEGERQRGIGLPELLDLESVELLALETKMERKQGDSKGSHSEVKLIECMPTAAPASM